MSSIFISTTIFMTILDIFLFSVDAVQVDKEMATQSSILTENPNNSELGSCCSIGHVIIDITEV